MVPNTKILTMHSDDHARTSEFSHTKYTESRNLHTSISKYRRLVGCGPWKDSRDWLSLGFPLPLRSTSMYRDGEDILRGHLAQQLHRGWVDDSLLHFSSS